MAKRGNLFVISGPAGAGKSEIVKTLLKKHPEIKLSVSCTTREMRVGEEEGISYHFVKDDRFDQLLAEDAFYEWAFVHQNRYGTLKSVVASTLDAGHDMILEIDVQGYRKVCEQEPDAVGIFVCPPSRDNLAKRLVDRGTESVESIRIRLANVAKELEAAYDYDYVIIHQDWNDVPDALQIAVDEVYAIITAKRIEKKNRIDFLDRLSGDLLS